MNRFIAMRVMTIVVVLVGVIPSGSAAAQDVVPTAHPSAGESHLFLPHISEAGAALHTTYNVVYQDNATVLDETIISDMLKSVSEDGLEYHFAPNAAAVAGLQPGAIVIFSGHSLRKVIAVSATADEIVLQTEEATLNQAIRDGTIAWTLPVKWLELPESVYAAAAIGERGSEFRVKEMIGFDRDGNPVPDATSQPSITYEGTIQGWNVTLKLTLSADRLDIDLDANHSIGSAQASVSGKGWISTFVQETLLTYEKSTPTNMSVKSLGVDGEMELKWAALTPGAEAITKIASFSIPAAIPIPIQAGPIPAVLTIKANLQIVPELRVAQASSGGSYKFRYNSDQGFTTEKNAASGTGQLNSVQIGLSGDTVSAGFGPVGFGLGIEFPRLELSILGIGVAFVTIKSYATSIFLTEPPCQKGTALLLAVAGYKLGALGFTIAEDQKELWREDFLKYKDDIPCDQFAANLANPTEITHWK